MGDELQLFVKWTEFLKWLLTTTEKFPKKVRFTFTTRIDNLALDILEDIIEFRYDKRAFSGKKDKARVAQFYFDMENELLRIREELRNKTYMPQPLWIFRIREPKVREIGASDFRDRVVHHAVCNIIEPILERGYVHHSYACRAGKGTHRAVQQAQIFSRKNYYYLKCDIRQYFRSIGREILKEIIVRKFKDPDLIWLLDTIIDNAQSDQPGKGIPIGSLTSQHFANLYLDRLDHHIKDSLRVKGYLRYMDDFILFGAEKTDLHSLHISIRNFLHDKLELELKEKATMLAPVREGIHFLGFRIFPNLIRLKQENKKRAFNTLKSRTRAFKAGKISEAEYSRSLMSITEHLKIANSYNLRKDVFNKMFF